MKMQFHFVWVALTAIGATLSSVILAADEQIFVDAAERWGLWAALTLALIISMLWGLYRMVSFCLNTLVDLVGANHQLMTKVSDAIREAPCGHDFDSDREDVERTPGGTEKAVRHARRRPEVGTE